MVPLVTPKYQETNTRSARPKGRVDLRRPVSKRRFPGSRLISNARRRVNTSLMAETSLASSDLKLFAENRDGYFHLFLRGALGPDTLRTFEEYMDRSDCCARPEVTIDLTGLDHLALVGARVLNGYRLYASTRGCRLRIVSGSPQIRSILDEAASELSSDLAAV